MYPLFYQNNKYLVYIFALLVGLVLFYFLPALIDTCRLFQKYNSILNVFKKSFLYQ